MINPLLKELSNNNRIPPFDIIKNSQFKEAVIFSINKQSSTIEKICSARNKPTFRNTIIPFLNSGNKLTEILSIFFSFCSTDLTKERESIRKELLPTISEHYSSIYQNEKLFDRINKIPEFKKNTELGIEQNRVLHLLKRDFIRSGIDLKIEDKTEYRKIIKELSILGVNFSQNIIKDEKDWIYFLKKRDIASLPKFLVNDLKFLAKSNGKKGYAINLKEALILPFLKFSDNRKLRKKVLKSWKSRGLKSGNSEIIKKTIILRQKLALLLGYKSYSNYRLETEMAKEPETVRNFLLDIWGPTKKKVKNEISELNRLLQIDGYSGKIKPWDWRYYAEKKREEEFNFNEDDVKSYFQLDKLIEAISYSCNRLFNLKLNKVDMKAYHKDCKVFEVLKHNQRIGLFIGDYYAREGKRSGAWCSTFKSQSKVNGKRLNPIVLNVCNFSKPQKGMPCLLTFDEAKTLFHEFGHALHQLLSDVNFEMLSGTSVSRDFVELPSQWFEHWLESKEILKKFTSHYKTKKNITSKLLKNVISSRTFNSGFDTTEYLASAIMDIKLHSEKPISNPIKLEKKYLNKIGLTKAIYPRHNLAQFQHIFSGGGYASAYYSYMWSEMMDEDAYSAFKETGDIFDKETAKSFEKNILSKGGTKEPEILYKAFRKKLPDPQILIKSRNL